jgi:hypothetical protein
VLGRGRTGVTYSFVLICHRRDDYWLFRVAYTTFGANMMSIMLSRLGSTLNAPKAIKIRCISAML